MLFRATSITVSLLAAVTSARADTAPTSESPAGVADAPLALIEHDAPRSLALGGEITFYQGRRFYDASLTAHYGGDTGLGFTASSSTTVDGFVGTVRAGATYRMRRKESLIVAHLETTLPQRQFVTGPDDEAPTLWTMAGGATGRSQLGHVILAADATVLTTVQTGQRSGGISTAGDHVIWVNLRGAVGVHVGSVIASVGVLGMIHSGAQSSAIGELQVAAPVGAIDVVAEISTDLRSSAYDFATNSVHSTAFDRLALELGARARW